MRRDATLSECGRYRYSLTRIWDLTRPRLGWLMLNPSTADAEIDDNTIRRCVGFARELRHPGFPPEGFGGIEVRNLYAFRATEPRELWQAARDGVDIIGPDNVRPSFTPSALVVVAAWGAATGAPSTHATRVRDIRWRLHTDGPPLLRLGALTKTGQPRHPLYLPSSAEPVPWLPGD